MVDSSTNPSDPQPTTDWPEDEVPSAAEPPPGYTTQVSLRAENAVPLVRSVAGDCRKRGWSIETVLDGMPTVLGPDDDLSEAFPRERLLFSVVRQLDYQQV